MIIVFVLDFSAVILPTVMVSSTPIIIASSPVEPQAASNDAVAGIVLVVLAIVIIFIYTCIPLVILICIQKRKIRQYEADRAAADSPEPQDYEPQDGRATLLSAYNIVSHDNPAYTPSITSNGHHPLPEYQSSSTTDATAPVISATNQLYVNSEVDTTSGHVPEPESRSNTSTLTYDYIPSSRSIIQ